MHGPWRRRLRLARRGLWYAAAVTLVLVALVVGIVSQLLPLASRHPDRVAEWLSARAGRPVRFDRLDTEWTRRGPLLRLSGLRVGEGQEAVAIGDAEILVSQYAGILPGRSFTELRVRKLALTLERHDDGRWQVRGLPGQQQNSDPLKSLEGLGELQVIDARLGISAPSLGIDTVVPDVDLRLQVSGARVRSGLRAWMRRDRAPLDAVLDFDRVRGDGRVYVGARDADLSVWAPLLHVAGVSATGGQGRAQMWATLRHHQVADVAIDGDLKELRLRGAPFADAPDTAPVASFARLRALAHWRTGPDGWRLDAPSLQVHAAADSAPQVLDGLIVAGGARYGLRADRIDAGPLFAVVALSDRLSPKLRRWLSSAKPGALLESVRVGGVRGGAMRVEADIRDLHAASVGNTPGVEGLAGHLCGDLDGYALRFDPKRTLRFLWPTGFGAPHNVHLTGEAVAWRDETSGWRVESPALHVDGEGYSADVRGGMWFQADGTRPAISMAADIGPARVPVAKRFWPQFVMAPALVHWLDTALVDGEVLDGRAVVVGDLDDWPFKPRDGQPAKGIFDARATLRDAVVKFQPEWAPATHMNADVAFIGNGFNVAGRAMLADVGVQQFSAGIADYHEAVLQIGAQADSDAGKFLALLRQSPLEREHGNTLSKLAASGPASTRLTLSIPFHVHPVKAQLDGDIDLRGVRLSDAEWKLAFAGVSGHARYDEGGFAADGLRAQYDRQDGRLSLRAGTRHTHDRRQGFEADLEASMSSDDLLDRSADLAWLKPHLRGRSRWTASIAIPATAMAKGTAPAGTTAAAPSPANDITHLLLRSDLVGTTVDLPAPLDKAAGVALPATLDLQLPVGKGEIAIALGQRLALRVKQTQGQTGIRAQFGSDRVADAPPPSGLVLGGRAGTLDALGWVALLRGGGNNRMPLRKVDVVADRLLLLGANFPDTRLQATPASGALAVQLDGSALAGALSIPDTEAATISGHLQRVHWRTAAPGAASAPVAAADADNAVDPSKIPPIALHVDDFRIGNAVLGDTQFRSHPTAAGMEVAQFQTRAPKRRIDVSGEWNGRGAAARTRVSALVASEDFGDLIGDLGLGGRIGSGKGEVRFDAAWPGTPMTFDIGGLEGSMRIAVKDGRLVDVEPGGTGRVLGLLNLAQLPRRLTLDFHDFFSKGFAFNRLGGNIRFEGGLARSDDLAIDGPAATINIRGAANLRAQTFDQTIEVLPKAGNLLTAVGALAGGPVGAAVGAVANAVFQKPLGQAAAKNYRVTGPWKDPKVEVIEHPAASAAAAPAPGKDPAR